MRAFLRFIAFLVVAAAVPVLADNQIYRYKDESGTVNFTNELYSIPEKYRHEAVPLIPQGSSAVERPKKEPALRVVTAAAEYRMGDHDTRLDAARMAIEAAKRQALEQVATYLESVTEVKELDVTRDEIRTYTAADGKLEALKSRFRDNTIRIFNKHQMTSIGYWVPQDAPRSQNTLIYILAHPSRDAAKANWAAFQADPEWVKVKADSEKDGRLVTNVDSVFADPADFSQIK